jgi:peptide/nickel transport system ATP-binding protein
MPSMDPNNRTQEAPLAGDPPNPIDPPPGCRFHTRCKFAAPICSAQQPPLAEVAAEHRVACLMAIPGSGHPRAPALASEAA